MGVRVESSRRRLRRTVGVRAACPAEEAVDLAAFIRVVFAASRRGVGAKPPAQSPDAFRAGIVFEAEPFGDGASRNSFADPIEHRAFVVAESGAQFTRESLERERRVGRPRTGARARAQRVLGARRSYDVLARSVFARGEVVAIAARCRAFDAQVAVAHGTHEIGVEAARRVDGDSRQAECFVGEEFGDAHRPFPLGDVVLPGEGFEDGAEAVVKRGPGSGFSATHGGNELGVGKGFGGVCSGVPVRVSGAWSRAVSRGCHGAGDSTASQRSACTRRIAISIVGARRFEAGGSGVVAEVNGRVRSWR